VQQRDVAFLADLHRTQGFEMGRQELAVEQFGAAAPQGSDQPGQRHFRSVAFPAEHAFAAEHALEADAVEAADESPLPVAVAPPAFDRMGVPEFMEPLIAGGDAAADPAFAAVAGIADRARRGAAFHHFGKSLVAGHFETAAAQSPGKRARKVEAVEGKDRAAAWLHPENLRIFAVVGHRKDAAAVSEHQQFRVDYRRGGSVHFPFLPILCREREPAFRTPRLPSRG